jgi:hypothetical protein
MPEEEEVEVEVEVEAAVVEVVEAAAMLGTGIAPDTELSFRLPLIYPPRADGPL